MRENTYSLVEGGIEIKETPLQNVLNQWAALISGYDSNTDELQTENKLILFTDENEVERLDVSTISEGDFIEMAAPHEQNAYFEVIEKKDDEIQLEQRKKRQVESHFLDTTDDEDVSEVISVSDDTKSQSDSDDDEDLEFTADSEIGDMDVRAVFTGEAYDEEGKPVNETNIGDASIFGYQFCYTIGSSLRVPETDLHAKMDSLPGIKSGMKPHAPRPRNAFCRALSNFFANPDIERVLDSSEYDFEPIPKRMENKNGQQVKFEVIMNEDPNGKSKRYDRTLLALERIHEEHITDEIDEDKLEEEGGTHFLKYQIGRFYFNTEDGIIRTYLRQEGREAGYEEFWEKRAVPQAKGLLELHTTHVTGQDIVTKVLSPFAKTWTESVRIRDGLYFTPAIYSDLGTTLESFYELCRWLDDNYKKMGKSTEFYFNPIMNSSHQQRMVHDRLHNKIERKTSDMMEEISERVDGDEIAEEVIADIIEEQKGMMEEEAEKYNNILQSKLNVKSIIEEKVKEFGLDVTEIIERELLELEEETDEKEMMADTN